MENLNQEQLDLIAKHLKGEASPFEEELLKEWLHENEENETIFREMSWIWKSAKLPVPSVPDVNQAWSKVKQKANIQELSALPDKEEGKIRRLFDFQPYLKIAASLVMLIGLSYLIKAVWFDKERVTELVSGDARKEYLLPDGSKVMLNKNSKLSYVESYNEDNRTVHLEGEGFFEVKKDQRKPFIVYGKVSRTEVLGTSFNVQTLKDGNADQIEVMTGRVSFAAKANPEKEKVILTPGEKAVAASTGKIEKSRMEDENFLAWRSDKLEFENTLLKDVLPVLESYFNITVTVENPELLQCRFTGSFEKPSIEELMKILSVSINISYSNQGKIYLLKGKGCN